MLCVSRCWLRRSFFVIPSTCDCRLLIERTTPDVVSEFYGSKTVHLFVLFGWTTASSLRISLGSCFPHGHNHAHCTQLQSRGDDDQHTSFHTSLMTSANTSWCLCVHEVCHLQPHELTSAQDGRYWCFNTLTKYLQCTREQIAPGQSQVSCDYERAPVHGSQTATLLCGANEAIRRGQAWRALCFGPTKLRNTKKLMITTDVEIQDII